MPSLAARRIFPRFHLLSWAWVAAMALMVVAGVYAQGSSAGKVAAPTLSQRPLVWPGIDVLQARGFDLLRGKRVGLLTNPAGVNRNGESTIDVLRQAKGVNLVALYGPEHGIYGDEKADTPIPDRVDARTGLPVFSLYGKYRKPTPEMLRGIDVMVVDLQDIGTRSYTYISCLRLVMEACFAQDKEVIVLDRPNPLGGLKVGGPMMEERWMSYVGEYKVPYVYGLTIGELARMAKDNVGWLDVPDDVRQRGVLLVVPMHGWHRSMLWPDTGLKWVPTSPGIINVPAAFGYGLTGLGGQLGKFSHGFGTPYPFRLLNYPGKTPEALAVTMKALHLPGLDFRPLHYKDAAGTDRSGAYVVVTDWNAVDPTELSFYMMKLAAAWDPAGNPFAEAKASDADLFNKHVGSTAWWEEITKKGARADVAGFFRIWDTEDAKYQQWSRRWWLYPV